MSQGGKLYVASFSWKLVIAIGTENHEKFKLLVY